MAPPPVHSSSGVYPWTRVESSSPARARRTRLAAAVACMAILASGCTTSRSDGEGSPTGTSPSASSPAPEPGPAESNGGSSGAAARTDQSGAPRGDGVESPTSDGVTTGRPEFRGRQPIAIAAGNPVYSDDPCEPTPVRLCNRDGIGGYVLLGEDPVPTTLTSIDMRPTRGATKWNVVLAVEDASALQRAARRANAAGGLLLLLSDQREVMATVRIELLPFPTVSGRRLRLFDRDKPEAWDLTEQLIAQLTDPTSLTP